jgi:uncharacterized protein (DUF4213/DUF364 family)
LSLKTIPEPLQILTEHYGLEVSRIRRMATGRRYSAIELTNGNIGVCANLGREIKMSIGDLKRPDLNNREHRILANAYFAALLNYENDVAETGDIYDAVDFRKYRRIVMVGLFRPLVKKFQDENVPLAIFDNLKTDQDLSPLEYMSETLQTAAAVILSSTTISNNTFVNIIGKIQPDCDVFMLGPSSILNREILNYPGIVAIFGTIFKKSDGDVLELIRRGAGTQEFQPLGQKIYCLRRG